MKIAIVGSGITGNVIAYNLCKDHDITVFESDDRIGGHTNTIQVSEEDNNFAIDTGFIVFNDRTYPNFIRLLEEIGQESQLSEMSFSVQSESTGLEYCGSSLNKLFAQRINIFRPKFYCMIYDILRFNKESLKIINNLDGSELVSEYLLRNKYSKTFIDHYLLPMSAAIWSAEPNSILNMPLKFLLNFFANHGLLQIKDRPQWKVIKGGSYQYINKLVANYRDKIRLNCPVLSISRSYKGVEIRTPSTEKECFDYVFMSCHSDQALSLLRDPTLPECEILSAMPYQTNEAVLHNDESLMPKNHKTWAAWNYHIPIEKAGKATLTYNMNILQKLKSKKQYLVTLNNDQN
ncbi:MAG: FAD-dependent oxidoreductase, partial [Gammaproteobacteria bacterium]|nr:FAD-dependent oxidoreductase [Gammaproteobacteria bacterium]